MGSSEQNLASGASAGIRVAIDARILPWRNGGVAHALVALIRTLAKLPDQNEHYRLFVDTEEEAAFWRPLLGPNQDLVARFEKSGTPSPMEPAPRVRRRTPRGLASLALSPVKSWIRRVVQPPPPPPVWPTVPLSDGFHESLGCDVLHLPWQSFILCSLPTIYNPHDLQYLHLPQFFTPEELAWRETNYSMGCRMAQTVVVGSQWAKQDIMQQYALHAAKIQVIPEGALNQWGRGFDSKTVEAVRAHYRLPERYLLYPAIFWAHKNHLRLLEALALLRDERGLTVPLVLTGTKREQYWPIVENRMRELRLQSEVLALGFIPEEDLRVIQQSAYGLVQPSLFEGSSLPIYDAWLDGVPVACSRATALPEQVNDAALLFDPLDLRAMADAIARLFTDSELRAALCDRGRRRLQDFDWTRTAQAYRAVYRRAAGVTLNEEDRWLLQWDWMREPNKSRCAPATQ